MPALHPVDAVVEIDWAKHVALRVLDGLASASALDSYHLLPAARAELLEQLGRIYEARVELDHAASLAGNRSYRGGWCPFC